MWPPNRNGLRSQTMARRPPGRRRVGFFTSGPIATARRVCGRSGSIRLPDGPAGPPLNIQHFHSRGLSWRNLYLGAPDLAVVRDRIVFNLGEHTGNVWMTELPGARQ